MYESSTIQNDGSNGIDVALFSNVFYCKRCNVQSAFNIRFIRNWCFCPSLYVNNSKIKISMKKKEKLTLIEGTFKSDDAKEILTSIFTAKIHFHAMRNFSSMERLGKKDEVGQKRIPELKHCIEQINRLIAEAQEKNKQVDISAIINIKLMD
jgi:hypothetical protein